MEQLTIPSASAMAMAEAIFGYFQYFGLFLAILCLTIVVIYARWNYGTLEATAIPGLSMTIIRPYFLFGSDPFSYRTRIQEQDLSWARAYGARHGVFGGYEGRAPQLYITDPELIRRIFVRDTEHFYDRRRLETGIPALDEQLDFMPGEKWKRVRAAVTPLFTSARLRSFSKVLNELANEGVADLRAHFGKDSETVLKMNPREFVIPILVEMTARCFLGISVEDWKNPDNEMIRLLKELAGESFVPSFWNTTLLQTFPCLRWIWARFAFPGWPGLDRLVKILEHLINARRAKDNRSSQVNDLVDVLETMMSRVGTPDYERLRITKDTVLTRGWSAFIPGYETMALVFTMCAYHFAKCPQAQERAAAEVRAFYGKVNKDGNGDVDLDAQTLATELPYLSACIQEVLRLHPAFSRPERMCNKDWNWTCDDDDDDIKGAKFPLSIKKGTNVVLLTWAANRNPVYFPDPEKFCPERWLNENPDFPHRDSIHPFAFTSFGFGHRNCVGQRLGVFVPKLIMARFLREFRFQDRGPTETVANLKPGSPALVRYEPFNVDVVRRRRWDGGQAGDRGRRQRLDSAAWA